ncbi:protein-disulfide reductase DsbD family protein [Tenacibaculum pacificus]|uniref:protein-disulfide reductase DsbD domain-containing protein n=1 Tax=Tenacibaculum TaxID=104267 RepID=UPI0022F3A4D7|nr:protein-disulfide reductase DsbD domain-containing protein [Tenacibaculum pacificus]WBX74058.1 protein-disulfide reductase DsbD family protein [Tenacibaculum pacificus]
MRELLTIAIFFVSVFSYGQMDNPVKWTTAVEKISEEEIELIAIVTLEDEWHIYSQKMEEGGPVATSFSFRGDQRYIKKGNTEEEEGHIVNDEIFAMSIKYFNNTAVFKQRIRLNTNEKFIIKGTVEYMVCSNESCLPPEEVALSFQVN